VWNNNDTLFSHFINFANNKTKQMKINLLSLLSFFSIAIIVNGQFLRKIENTVQDFDLAKLGRSSRAVEQLSLKQATVADLVNSRPFVPEDPVPNPEDPVPNPDDVTWNYVYNQCDDYGSLSGNGHVIKNTTKIYGYVGQITGCIALNVEKWNGTAFSDGGYEPSRPCTGNASRIAWWGTFTPYKVVVFEAEGDTFNLTVCWD
jgi:hypothetical protein